MPGIKGERPGLMLYRDDFPALLSLDNDALGRVFRAIVSHFLNDDFFPDFESGSGEAVAFASLLARNEKDRIMYKRKSERYASNGRKGSDARWKNGNRQQSLAIVSNRQQSVANYGDDGQPQPQLSKGIAKHGFD